MVTFRFYVVSTVAFFLALAVGVVVGSVLDGRIADSLQDRLDGVERSLDDTVAVIDARKAELERDQSYIEASAPYAVQDRLRGTATLVVAESGVEAAPVEDLVRRARESGSRVEGIVWLDRRWDLEDPADLALAADIAGLPDTATADEVRTALWETVLAIDSDAKRSAYAQGGASATNETPSTTTSTTSSTTTTAPVAVADVVPQLFEGDQLVALADAGLLRLQTIDGDLNLKSAELVVTGVTGTESTLGDPGVRVSEMLEIAGGAGLSAVMGEALALPEGDDVLEPPRGELSSQLVDSDSTRISTVDDVDLVAGRVATILALAEGMDGLSGRYGFGPDVDGVLPAWQGP